MAALLNRVRDRVAAPGDRGPAPARPGRASRCERLLAFGHSRMELNLAARRADPGGGPRRRALVRRRLLRRHARALPARPSSTSAATSSFLATALLAPLEMIVLVQQTRDRGDPARPHPAPAGTTWSAAWSSATRSTSRRRRVVRTSRAGAGRPRGRRPRPGRPARAAAPPRRAGRPASRRPGRPSAVQCSGSETAGIPVTFHADVHGVNAFCASKSAAGSSSSRIAPTGSGGTARVGVSTASYGARVVRQSAANRRIAPIASPNSGPDTARPRSASQRVSGRSSGSRSGGTDRQRGQHRPAGLEGRHRLARHRHGDVLDLVAEATRAAPRRPPRPARTRGPPRCR